ncbi:MAG: cobalamin B12-binding domain-containing protein [Rhodocyclaceae bacterium]|nr:cobalamin B12-binding domain-containing protein [Rhodocyclaceae bacterium]
MSAMSMSAGHDAGDSADSDSADGENWVGARTWQAGQDLAAAAGRGTRQMLLQTLGAEIIPRLLRSHQPAGVDLPHHIPTALSQGDIEAFVRDCIAGDPSAHEQRFAALRADGHDLPELYLDLLAPTARAIGRLWESDDCTFPEVTLAVFRLQSLVHGLNDEFCANPAHRDPQHRILLAPVPGSHHTLGFYMLAQFFRRDGWSVCSAIEADPATLVAAARADWYDIVALSISCDSEIERLQTLVHDIRGASLNPRVGIMIGGPLGLDDRLRTLLCAEAYSGDAREALRTAHGLVHERGRPN